MPAILKREFNIDKIIQETSRTKTFVLSPVDKLPFNFISGQWVNLSLIPTQENPIVASRPYSIASSPANNSSIQITFNIVGSFTNQLDKMQVNEKVMVMGPFGHFKFIESEIKNAVFIAGGIGITPMMSMARYSNDKQLSLPITFLYSNKSIESVAFFSELNELAKSNKHMDMVFTLTSSDSLPENWNGETGRINKQMIEKYVKDVSQSTYFICGPIKMTQEIATLLKEELNVQSECIKVEGWG